MLYQVLKSKIHRATVTDANIDYEGSITLDADLIKAAKLIPYEMVHIWNITNGERIYTYVLPAAPKGSGTVCINGSAAHKIKKGHLIILTSFVQLTPKEIKKHKPQKVLVDAHNKIKSIKRD